MININIRQVNKDDVDGCYRTESACYTSDGATREKILKRIMLFPEGFLIAESEGEIIGLINSASTDKEEITDEELKDMVHCYSVGYRFRDQHRQHPHCQHVHPE